MANLPAPNLTIRTKSRNPRTKAAHGKDFRYQILLPILLFLIGFISLVIWLSVNKVGNPKIWAEITVILSIVPLLIFGIIFLGLFIGLIVLTILINRELPPLAYNTQLAIFKIKDQVVKGADVSSMSMIQVSSFLATVDAIFSLFRGKDER